MYPGKNAIDLESLPPVGSSQPPYNIIIIDGTWQQAKSMFFNSRQLHNLRQVKKCTFFYSDLMVFCSFIMTVKLQYIWRPPSLSELTPMIFNMGLTQLGLEASI